MILYKYKNELFLIPTEAATATCSILNVIDQNEIKNQSNLAAFRANIFHLPCSFFQSINMSVSIGGQPGLWATTLCLAKFTGTVSLS
jgi:hypothetical protein